MELLAQVRDQSSVPPDLHQSMSRALGEISQLNQQSLKASNDDNCVDIHRKTPLLVESSQNDHDIEEDLVVEYIRLSNQDTSSFSIDEQLAHVLRFSALDANMHALDVDLNRTQKDEIIPTPLAVAAQQDIAAIGNLLSAWPLPLNLEYPSPRMNRTNGNFPEHIGTAIDYIQALC